jgi:hypothetical protein
MDVLLIMIILGAVVVFVTAPLRRVPDGGAVAEEAPGVPIEPDIAELEAARDAKLRELRDAELDHRTGKLSDADFQAIDATLRTEAIEILRELDQARERSAAEDGRGHSAADTMGN